jgi:hypothetical protein
MPEKEDKTNIKNGEYRVTGNTIPGKEDQINIKNGEFRVTGNNTIFLIFVLSSFSGIVLLPVTLNSPFLIFI